jgi:hypothetical protein
MDSGEPVTQKRGRRVRIKGTDFELNNWYYPDTGEREIIAFLPLDYVEFYDPPRKEPGPGNIEVGESGTIYIAVGDVWYYHHPSHGWVWLRWQALQHHDGPTKPVELPKK